MNSYKKIYNLLTERRGRKSKEARKARGGAKQKQARIKLDKYKTERGATASNQADDPRRSPSLSTDHNSPEDIERRKHQVVISRSDRANQKHADDVARGREEKRQRDQAAIDKANKEEKDRKRAARVAAGLQSPPGQKMSQRTRRTYERGR